MTWSVVTGTWSTGLTKGPWRVDHPGGYHGCYADLAAALVAAYDPDDPSLLPPD